MREVNFKCDDNSGSRLRLVQSDDGDIWVSVIRASDGLGLQNAVRFCTIQGGGKNLRARYLLQQLFDEMVCKVCGWTGTLADTVAQVKDIGVANCPNCGASGHDKLITTEERYRYEPSGRPGVPLITEEEGPFSDRLDENETIELTEEVCGKPKGSCCECDDDTCGLHVLAQAEKAAAESPEPEEEKRKPCPKEPCETCDEKLPGFKDCIPF